MQSAYYAVLAKIYEEMESSILASPYAVSPQERRAKADALVRAEIELHNGRRGPLHSNILSLAPSAPAHSLDTLLAVRRRFGTNPAAHCRTCLHLLDITVAEGSSQIFLP